jgi:hypothetical protein
MTGAASVQGSNVFSPYKLVEQTAANSSTRAANAVPGITEKERNMAYLFVLVYSFAVWSPPSGGVPHGSSACNPPRQLQLVSSASSSEPLLNPGSLHFLIASPCSLFVALHLRLETQSHSIDIHLSFFLYICFFTFLVFFYFHASVMSLTFTFNSLSRYLILPASFYSVTHNGTASLFLFLFSTAVILGGGKLA